MNKILLISLLLLSLNVCLSRFVLQSDWDSITQQALIEDPLIEVEGTSKHFNIDEYELTHLKFVQSGKNKRKTYQNFIRKYKKITGCLIKYQIVPHQTAMIHTNIQMNFNNKKRLWQFSRVFVVYSNHDQLNKVLNYLEPFKLATLKERLVMGYLNEKLLAIKAFTSAKTKLQKFLKKKLSSKLQITYIIDIQIKGKKFINEEDIQVQIKKQNNYSKGKNEVEVVPRSDSKSKQKRHQDYKKDILEEDAQVKVLFKVGNPKESDQRVQLQQNQNLSDDSEAVDIDDQQIQISPEGEAVDDL